MRLIRPALFLLLGAALGVSASLLFRPASPAGDAAREVTGRVGTVAPAVAGADGGADGGGAGSGAATPSALAPVANLPESAEAEVRPLRSSELTFAVAGVLAERLVSIGADVTAGDALLRLDDAAERARLSEADAALAAAEAQVAVARTAEASARQQVVAATAAVSAAEAARDAADATLRLTATQAEATIAQATAQLRQAEANVAQAQASVAQAQAAVDQAQAQVVKAQAQRDQAAAAQASARLAVDQRTLRAPFDGRVLALGPEVGETVALAGGSSGATGDVVAGPVTLADVSGWRVETTNLTELQVVAVAVGDPVTVEVDALPGRSFSGTVERIGFSARLVRGDVTYVASVRIDDADADPEALAALRPGMTAVVRDLVP